MKTISKFAFVFLVFVGVISCTNDGTEKETASKASMTNYAYREPKGMTPADIAFFHNEAIRLYDEAYLSKGVDINTQTIEQIINTAAELLKKEYPEQFNDVDTKAALDFYKNYKNIEDYDFAKNWDLVKTSYISSGQIPAELAELIDKSLAADDDYAGLMSKIEELEATNSFTDKDKELLDVFKQVTVASNELWTGTSNVAQNKKNWCNHQILISDGTVAFITWYLGPVSALASMASSLITASTGDCTK